MSSRNARIAVAIAAIAVLMFVVSSRAQDAAALAKQGTADSASSSANASGGAAGTWRWQQPGRGGTVDVTLKLKQDGEKLTGTISGFGGGDQELDIQDGTFKDGKVTFKIVRDFGGRQSVTTYTGKIEGNSFKGKAETVMTAEIDAKRD